MVLLDITNQWPLARVLETFRGKDGRIKTSTSVFKRPITKVALVMRDDSPQLELSKDHLAFGGENVGAPPLQARLTRSAVRNLHGHI